jgi:transcriptional regulator with XRE-family HTH domain
MTIHENIKRLRLEKNLTLEELGKKVGTTKQTIKRYESGEISTIPYDKIVLLADTLGVAPGVLMGWQREFSIESAELDVKLTNMENRLKEYALKLSQMPKEKQEHIMNLIDMLSE